jgi:hypothetical protein
MIPGTSACPPALSACRHAHGAEAAAEAAVHAHHAAPEEPPGKASYDARVSQELVELLTPAEKSAAMSEPTRNGGSDLFCQPDE